MNLKVKVIAAVLIVAVLGVGGALASRTWDPLWNPFRPVPEKIIEKSVEAQKKIKTSHTEGKLDLNFESPSTAFTIKLDFDQDVDSSDPEKVKSKSNIKADIAVEKAENMNTNLGGLSFTTEADLRVLDDKVYAKVNNIPPLPNAPQAVVDKLENQWIESEMRSQTGQEQVDENLQEQVEEIVKFDKLVNVEKEYSDEKIGGTKAYHYLVSLNKKEVKKELPELIRLTSPSTVEEKVEEMKKNIDELFSKTGPFEAEVWIGQKELLLRKMKFDKKINAEDFKEGGKGTVGIDLAIEFSDFGKSVKVEAPESSKTLQELMMIMMGPLGPGGGTQQLPSDQLPEDYNLPQGTEIPEGTNLAQGTEVPQLPMKDYGGPASLLPLMQGIF